MARGILGVFRIRFLLTIASKLAQGARSLDESEMDGHLIQTVR
jgi:hypothetical protein